MPVPQVPRRAAPPRKKSSQKHTPPAEAEAIASSPEKGTTIHDSSSAPSESPSGPIPIQDDVEPEVKAADPDADDVHLSDLADKNLELTEQASGVTVPPILSPEEESAPAPPRPASPPLEPQLDSLDLDNPDVDPSPTQAPEDMAEPTVPSIPTASQVTQEETEAEEVAIPHASNDDALVAADEEEVEDDTDRGQGIAEHLAEMGGEELPNISSAAAAVENLPAASAVSSESVSYEVFQQGGGATAVDGDDGNDGKY